MKQVHRRVVGLGILLLVVTIMTAVTALNVTTPTTTFALDSRHRTPTPTPTSTIPPLVITTTSLPDGNIGTNYDAFVLASGGQGTPKMWSLIAGTLPDGLKMANFYGVQSTIIFGTPTKVQTTNFTVQATDSTGHVATQPLSITINTPPPLVITSVTPPPATVGTAYFTNLFANGGVQPYTWSITAGQLPPGLALVKGSNGGTTISGTPTAKGTFTFTETVTDSTGVHASQQFSITVN
jgi:large repetitive protein